MGWQGLPLLLLAASCLQPIGITSCIGITTFAINTCIAKHVSNTVEEGTFSTCLSYFYCVAIIRPMIICSHFSLSVWGWNIFAHFLQKVCCWNVPFGLLLLKWFCPLIPALVRPAFILEGGRRVKAIMGQYSFIVHSMKFICSIMFSFVFFWLLWSCQLERMGGGFPKSRQAMEDQGRR